MDHYFFIWCAYGASALILGWTAFAPMMAHRRALRERQANNDTGTQHDSHA